MSYADMAAKGPSQSAEEKYKYSRAPPVPALEPSESTTSSLIDVDSPHISSVKSDFEEQKIKTETQADRLEREAEDRVRAAAHKAEDAAESLKKQAATKAKEAKKELKKDGQKLNENRDNPVLIGNALIWGIGAIAIGYGAYQKHSEGKLDGALAGTFIAGIAAFGVADYFASKWLLENKYPPK